MIDWFGLVFNALWVVGLALLLAAAGWRGAGGKARDGLEQPDIKLMVNIGFLLFCLGLALTTTCWLALLWLGLAAWWGVGRVARGGERVASGGWRMWLAEGGWAVAGLIVMGSLLVVSYSLVIRPWMQPDEPRHFEVVQHTARLARPVYYPDLVLDWEQEIIADMEAQDFWWYGFSVVGWDPQALPEDFTAIWGQMYSRAFFQQPVYYMLMGGLLRQWWLLEPLAVQVLWLRLMGAVLFAATLWGVYAAGRELFPDRFRLYLAALALAALWPSHIATFAAVNNDTLVELWVVWAIFFGIRLIRRGATATNVTALVAFGLLAILTKRSGLVVLVLPLALLLRVVIEPAGGDLSRQQRTRWSSRVVWAFVATIVTVAAMGGLWVAAQSTGRIWAPPEFLRSLTNGDFVRLASQSPLGHFADVLLRTFIGWFGWLRVPLPPVFYWVGLLVVIAATGALLVGYARIFWSGAIDRNGGRLERWQRASLLFLAALLATQFVLAVGKDIVYGFWQDGSAPQARYLYPVLPAIVLPVALGISSVLRPHWLRLTTEAAIVLLTLFNLYVIGLVLYPFFWL